jgi:hypothetical protein
LAGEAGAGRPDPPNWHDDHDRKIQRLGPRAALCPAGHEDDGVNTHAHAAG